MLRQLLLIVVNLASARPSVIRNSEVTDAAKSSILFFLRQSAINGQELAGVLVPSCTLSSDKLFVMARGGCRAGSYSHISQVEGVLALAHPVFLDRIEILWVDVLRRRVHVGVRCRIHLSIQWRLTFFHHQAVFLEGRVVALICFPTRDGVVHAWRRVHGGLGRPVFPGIDRYTLLEACSLHLKFAHLAIVSVVN